MGRGRAEQTCLLCRALADTMSPRVSCPGLCRAAEPSCFICGGQAVSPGDSRPGPADTELDLKFQQEGLLFNNGGPPFPIGSC